MQVGTAHLLGVTVMLFANKLPRLLPLICLFCLGVCISGCMSTLDNVFYNVQDEYDASGGSSRESVAIVEASSSMFNPLLTEYSCFFPVPSGEEVVNARRIIFEPGARKFPVRCRVDSPYAQNNAEYRRLFEVDLRKSGLYEVRTDGSRFNATTHCLIIVDVSTDAEVARSCDEPFWKDDPNGFCTMGIDWMC